MSLIGYISYELDQGRIGILGFQLLGNCQEGIGKLMGELSPVGADGVVLGRNDRNVGANAAAQAHLFCSRSGRRQSVNQGGGGSWGAIGTDSHRRATNLHGGGTL